MKPLVSVIMPVHNGARYIAPAIRSVLDQTYRDQELLVIDDGSTDESGAIAASFPGVRVLRPGRVGVSAARNLGLREAKGELICFLDADDLFGKEKTEKQVRYLLEHPECGIVFCLHENFTDLDEAKMNERQRTLLHSEVSRYLTDACIRRELFDTFGHFREDYPYGEDTEWMARLKLAQIDLTHRVDEILYLRRVHEENLSLTHGDMSEKARFSIMADAIREKWRREKQRG